MLKFFRHIRTKLIDHPPKGQIENIISTKVLDSIDELLLVVKGNTCPVWNFAWVETMESPNPHRALRSRMAIISGYGIGRNTDVATHMVYQPMVGHGLRHAGLCLHSKFYSYLLSRRDRDLRPTRQMISVKSFNP